MKKVFISALLIIQTICAIAQQIPVVSYFMYDYTRTNPGSLGSLDMVCASLIMKSEMVGMPGKPQTNFLNVDIPFKLFGAKHGVGLTFNNDVIGFNTDLNLKLGYAYRFNVGDGTMGIGVSGGYKQKKLKAEWVGNGSTVDPIDDKYIPDADAAATTYNIGAGLFYRTDDIYFGASVLNLVAKEIDYSEKSGGNKIAKEKLVPHYFVTAGYLLPFSNSAFEFQPAVSLYSEGVSVTFDINGTVTYNKKLWAGVSYRAGSAIVGMFGLTILDGFKVGYAYDFKTSALSGKYGSSHEILLNYCFKLGVEKSPQRYKSIRYL